jgi:N6-adenosine-specific RNA methylase IME4/ParB-like chromosome segregation protein Spo0J
MAAIEFPLPKVVGIAIVAAAVRDGEYRSKSANETIAANLCVVQRYLTRDPKDGNLFRPGEHAVGMLDRARELGKLPAVDPETGSGSKVAVLRDPATINSDDRLRDLGENTVLGLMEAFQRVGQHQPIEVFGKETDATVKLGAGGHRLEACRRLGIKVLCFHYDGDDLDRQLCEIDENLIREDLSQVDRALFLARRKEIYLIKYPETANGGDRKSDRKLCDLKKDDAKRFTAATAALTGQNERTIQLDIERGEKISKVALQMLRGTSHNKGTLLDRLKRMETAEAQENFVRELIASDKAITGKSKQIRTAQQADNRQSRLQMVSLLARHSRKAGEEMPRAAFPIGYADPAWEQEAWSNDTGQDKGLKYPSMTVEEIKALCAGDKSPFTRDAVLLLWVTANRLPDGIAVLQAWGFEYVTCMVWDKQHIGMGRWVRDRHEILLIGKRGTISLAPLMGTQPESLYSETKTEHSRKPVWFAEQIERLWPDLRKIELFQRKDSLAPDDVRLGGNWEFWGNQAGTPEGGAE